MEDTEINFNWNEPIKQTVNHIGGCETLPADAFNRGQYAKFLHNYLVDNSLESGYVLNLNAPWGTGKTYFINRWINSIKEKHPVVYIDAWKQDYSNDPMLSVVSSIISVLETHLPKGNKEAIKVINKAAYFFKAAAPLLAKGLIKKTTGMDIDEIEQSKGDMYEDKELYDLSGDIGASLAKCLVDDHNEKLKKLEHLRDDIKSLICAIDPQKNLDTPAFIFIDELDRCRPSYAVEMLEVIKHFFELEKIVFVVATDTEQLQHAVKVVYGEGFDAQTYLGRFFRRRYSLPFSTSSDEFIKNMIGDKYRIKEEWSSYFPAITTFNGLCSLISTVASGFNLSLRDTEQLTDKFLAVLSNEKSSMNPYLLLILFVLQDKYFSVYDVWRNNKFQSDVQIDKKLQSIINESQIHHIKMIFNNDADYISSKSHKKSTSLSLLDILKLMYKYSSIYCSEEKDKNIEELRDSFSVNRFNNDDLSKLKINLINLDAKREQYIQWVEFSVSFDD